MPITPQIEKFALKYNIEFPDEWKVEME